MEKEILLFFHKTIANPVLDIIMVYLTNKGWMLSIPVFIVLVWSFFKNRNYLIILYLTFSLIISIFFSDWFSEEIKTFFQRIRPCWYIDFRDLIGCTHSYSFPSNHASNSFVIGSVYFLFIRHHLAQSKIRKFLYFYILSAALLISLSRVYMGVHWPTDVLGGALIGLIIGFSVFKATNSVCNLKRFFYFFLIVLSLFRIYFILHGPLDLSPDEAHYWEWSRRLDLSYYSKGPMIAYLVALSTWIFGDNPFGVRILAVVCSFLSGIFVYKIGKRLFNEDVGYLSGILFQLIPLFSTFGVIFTIDSPFILFWIVSIYIFLLAIEGRKTYYLLLGLFIGFGLLTKYTMAFFYLCMFIYLLKKADFKNPIIYLCIAISILVFSPVIIWNFQHGWVTLKHTAGQAHLYEGFKISMKYFLEFIGSQLAVVSPLVFILGLLFIVKPRFLRLEQKNWWFLISFSMPVFVFFLLKSIQGKVQANWAMPAYVPFIICMAYAFKEKIYRKLVLLAMLLAFVFTFLNYALPYFNLPAKFDPSARLKGWKALGNRVSEIKESLEKEASIIVFSDKYQISSELAFYVKGKPKVYCILLSRRMNQYDLWEDINSELKNEKVHGIYVVYGTKQLPKKEVLDGFERCSPESFTVYQKQNKIRDFTVFTCYNFKGMNLPKPESY